MSLEDLKESIREEAAENPERYFAVESIRKAGFFRSECTNCGTMFWSTDQDREVCGEPDCGEGYTFINDSPTEKTFDVVSAWKEFSNFMEERGYTPVERYPLAARWRDDTEVVRASIYDFQPYVVSGEVEPPANPLVVPQFCFRSNDIDNVGITGRHYTGFIMVGQHAFTSPEDYEQEKYFEDMLAWVTEGMGIEKEELILHEDAWGGGGNLGACMEFFVRGLELFNQVYMFYEVDEGEEKGYRELDTKVLDMGMGHERVVWITHGSETSYEANMKTVVEKLYDTTGVEPDREVWEDFLPYSGHLNLDEVDDIEETWEFISGEIGVGVDRLKEEVMPAAALYAIADHTRCLLVALNDGLLPSNAGERHSLRVMVRRCFDFIDRYNWEIDLGDVIEWHAEEFGDLFPELKENVEDVKKIIYHEEEKFERMKEEAERIMEDLDVVDRDRLLELYDTRGITPDMLERHGIDFERPPNFYQLVTEMQEVQEKKGREKKIDVDGFEETESLYLQDEYLQDFEAEVLGTADDHVVLDRTAFYPTVGGQEHDTGTLDGSPVTDVINRKGVVLHRIDGKLPEKGERISGSVNWERRTRLRKHHTATHIINGAAREILGNHVWQSGSHKSEDKGRLDITHYRKLDRETLESIEERANEIVEEDLEVRRKVMERNEAEGEYGFRIYQGGAVPGKRIRVVEIPGFDSEACGGTHCRTTGEVGRIRITSSRKIQDGTVRIEYVAGEVADRYEDERENIREELEKYVETSLSLEEVADIFSTELEHLPRVVERFVEEWEEREEEIEDLKRETGREEPSYGDRPRDPEVLFDEWKQMEKDLEDLNQYLEEKIKEELSVSEEKILEENIETEDVGLLIRVSRHLVNENPSSAVILKGSSAVVGASGSESDFNARERLEELARNVEGNEKFAKGFDLR